MKGFAAILLLILISYAASSQEAMLRLDHVGSFSGGPRDDGSAFTINDKGYYGLGNDLYFQVRKDMWCFDPMTKNWTEVASIPTNARQYSLGFNSSDHGFVLGGILDVGDFTNELLVYDPSSNTWEVFQAPFEARAKMAGFRIGHNFYCGGGVSDSLVHSDFWKFDMHSLTWEKMDDLPFEPRFDMVGFQSNGIGWMGLGQDTNSHLKNIWSYDPASGNWKAIGDFPGQSRSYIAVSETNFGVIFFGGQDENTKLTNEVYLLNTANMDWSLVSDSPSISLRGSKGFTIDQTSYFVGGLTENYTRIDSVFKIQNPLTFQFDNWLHVWPNPSRELVSYYYDQTDLQDCSLLIYDCTGTIIQVPHNNNQFDFSDQENGIYTLELSCSNKDKTARIVIQK